MKIEEFSFPPYVSYSPELSSNDWNKALTAWGVGLSLLLKASVSEFVEALLSNKSLQKFLKTFFALRKKISNKNNKPNFGENVQQLEIDLDKKVLMVLLPKALYREQLITEGFLLDLVSTYGKSNPNYTKKIFESIINFVPELIQDLEKLPVVIIKYVNAIEDKFGKNQIEPLEEEKTYLAFMIDISITLDCLFSISKKIAKIFNKSTDSDQNFLLIMIKFYDEAIPIMKEVLKNEDYETSRNLSILKYSIVSMVYRIIDASYFSSIGYTSNENDILSFERQSTQIEKPFEAFVDAPLLLDLEIEFDLNYINRFLEELRNMNQDSERIPWRLKLEEKLKQHSQDISNINSFNRDGQSSKINNFVESDKHDQMTLILQVQEILPDLGQGFINECLKFYDESDDNSIESINISSQEENLVGKRQNIFDNDEFDVFSGKELDPSHVRQGKKIGLKMGGFNLHMVDEFDEEADAEREEKSKLDPAIICESEFIKAFQSDPSVFERTKESRKSRNREHLKKITQMTDEQIEGWYIMFQRNPRKDKLLAKYEWSGEQEQLNSSSKNFRVEIKENTGITIEETHILKKWQKDLDH
ncbi:10375_t:CDS:10 [Entrophospora sp. SA101]|nr:10375_t:CDS:10 [Entrophospora sp. SA101]